MKGHITLVFTVRQSTHLEVISTCINIVNEQLKTNQKSLIAKKTFLIAKIQIKT